MKIISVAGIWDGNLKGGGMVYGTERVMGFGNRVWILDIIFYLGGDKGTTIIPT